MLFLPSILLGGLLRLQSTTTTSEPSFAPATQTTAPTTAPASAIADKAFAIPGHGDLHILVPGDWKVVNDPPPPGLPQTVRFNDPTGKFEMLVSIVPVPQGQDPKSFNTPEKLRSIAQTQGSQLLKLANETTVDLEEIKGAASTGYAYSLSAKSPTPGSPPFMTGGIVGVGDLILSVTMLMHEKGAPQRSAALAMLAGAWQTAPAAAPATQPASTRQTIAAALPDKNWQIAIDAPGELKVARDETTPDKRARQFLAVDEQHGLTISIFLEPAVTIGDARTARAFYFERLKRSPILMREDKLSDGPGGSARVDYLIPDIEQRHVNLYFAKEGIWVDVHLSVDPPKPDQPPEGAMNLLEEIIKSARIEPKTPAPATTQSKP